MDRISGDTTVDIGGGKRGFVDEDLLGPVIGTDVTALWLNMVQEEIAGIIEGAGIALDPGDWAQLGKALQSGRLTYAVAGGTANAVTAALSPAPSALMVGMRVLIKIASVNTSDAVTLNLNGLGAATVYRRNSATLRAGDIQPGLNEFIWDGTYWRIANPAFGTSTIANNGYIDLPGGLTMQWGAGTISSGTQTITFPKAFSATPYSLVAIDSGAAGWSTSNASFLGMADKTATTATFKSVTWNGTAMIQTTTVFNWVAVGPT